MPSGSSMRDAPTRGLRILLLSAGVMFTGYCCLLSTNVGSERGYTGLPLGFIRKEEGATSRLDDVDLLGVGGSISHDGWCRRNNRRVSGEEIERPRRG
jgi:hypothetical protein